MGFACAFFTLFLWRKADVNSEELEASYQTYDEESNKALQDIIAFEEKFIKYEISYIDATEVSLLDKVDKIKKENKDLAEYLDRDRNAQDV